MGRVFKPLQGGGVQVAKFEAMPMSCSADHYCATNNIDMNAAAADLKIAPTIAPEI
ncbi:MAG: hypothetical protein JKY11_05355 [Alphaproteobacteria bacterium]|nr:hypothetical protein [Alphaproteobacteria bacterium]